MDDEYDIPKHLRDMLNLSEEDNRKWRETAFRLKYDNDDSVNAYLSARALKLMVENPIQGIRLLRAVILIAGYEPPLPKRDETVEDFVNYLAQIAPLLRQIGRDEVKRWAKDHWRK
jgi:hypothetical protein